MFEKQADLKLVKSRNISPPGSILVR